MRITKKQIDEIIAYDATKRDPGSIRSLRYNYIVPDKTRDPAKRDVTVCHVAVKPDKKTNRPVVKVVSVADLKDLDNGGKLKIRIRDLYFRFIVGWLVAWNDDDFKRNEIDDWWNREKEAWETIDHTYRCGVAFTWFDTVNPDALQNTRYRYCQYKDGHATGLLDWLVLYRQEPRIELLAKAKLFQLISPKGLSALKDKRVARYVKENLIDRQPEFQATVREIVYAAKHGKSLYDAADHFAFVNDMVRIVPRRTNRFNIGGEKPADFTLDYERVRRQLPKWDVTKEEYARYLHEAVDYGLDLKNEGTLYPPVRDGRKTFMERLERLEAENQARHRAEERKRQRELRKQRKEADEKRRKQLEKEAEYMKRTMTERFAEIEDFQRGVDRIRRISGNGCTIVLAKTEEELRKEGRRMNNCVGGGTYGRGIVMGDTIIVMFKDAKGHSWCDAEINRKTWTVRQCYARGNAAAPKEIEQIAHEIASELKKMHAKHRKDKTFPELLKRNVA